MLGHAYLVTRYLPNKTIELSRIKIGFFGGNDLENQVHRSYARSLTPVAIYDYIPAHNARWTETCLHSALNKWRINPQNEIFDLSSSEARQVYNKIKGYIIEIVNLSGLPKPMERTINYPYWLIARKAAKVGKKWNKKFNEVEEKKKLEIQKSEKKEEAIKIKLEKEKNIVYNRSHNIKKREIEQSKEEHLHNIEIYINNNLIRDNDKTVYVRKKDLYEDFKKKYQQESNKKIAIGPKEFFKQILKILGHSCYKDRYGKDRIRDVFLGWKYRNGNI